MESPFTDAQLVAATLSGSLSAFEALVLRHQDRLYLQALRYMRAKEEAQDALQDAFLKAFNQLENLQEHSRFPSWASQILRNICLNRLRENRRRQAMSVVEETYLGEHPEQPVIRNAAFEELLSGLPEKSALAFILHYLEGYSIQDVALQVRTTPSGVKQRLYRARKQLQEEVTRMAKDDRNDRRQTPNCRGERSLAPTCKAIRISLNSSHLWLLWMVGTALVVVPSVPAHEKPSEKEVWAFRANLRPTIDGVLDDEDWARATPATGFILIEPEEGVPATNQTFIHILYDADYLYIGLNMMDAEPGNIKGRIMQRDGRFAPLDLVGLVLDTYHDHQNAYGFYINAYGVQNDFRVENDGSGGWGGIDQSWDGIWQAETHVHDQGWSAEIAIPFKTLRFPELDQHTWGINVQRIERTYTENSNWAFISRDDRYLLKVSKAGHLHGLEAIKPGLHLEVLPYATGGYGNVGSRSADGWSSDFGLDLKYSIASNLTLDTTFNPDFAHIEADENQINLTRFELYLPEKRPFFLEGQQLFTAMDLFYSRRISDPDAGAKITGKIGKNSVGMIAARNRPADGEGDPPHFGVLRLKRDVGVNSSIGALAVGKDGPLGQQAVGSDLVLSLNDNDKLFLNSAMSFDAGTDQNNKMYSGRFRHSSDRFPFGIWGSWIEPKFNVDQIGFISHDADVGEREVGLYGSYGWRPDFLGIRNIYLGQNLVAERRTNEEGWEWRWSNVNVNVRRLDDSQAFFSHHNWQLRWQQKKYNGDSFSAGFDTGNGRKYRLRLIGQLRDQYDFADEYLGDIRRVSGSLRFDLWEGFFLDSSTESVWEYFPSGALDEVKRVLLVRTTYFLHRDLFIRSFFQRSFHRDTVDLNLLFSYTFGANNSRFYIAYNERRTDTTERILLTKLSYRFNF